MNRLVVLSVEPYERITRFNLQQEHTVLAPNQEAARTLNLPYLSLDRLCRRILASHGLSIASPLVAYRLLKKAIITVLNPADPAAKTRSLIVTVREIFLTGTSHEALQRVDNLRFQKMVAVAAAYRSLLEAQYLVDPGDMFWAASRLPIPRQKIVLYGYPRLRMDMLHFIDTLCDNGSAILIPYYPASAFEGSRSAADWLSAKGWQAEKEEKETSRTALNYSLCARYLGLNLKPGPVLASIYPTVQAEVRGTLSAK